MWFSWLRAIQTNERKDFLLFLDSYWKYERVDPMHKRIGTYNLFLITIIRFFRWWYFRDIAPKNRKKSKTVDNITRLKIKEQPYKPTNLWTKEDELLFIKYCPSKHIKCSHATSRDTNCRLQTYILRKQYHYYQLKQMQYILSVMFQWLLIS